MEELVDKSLLITSFEGDVALYRMLDVTRVYAGLKLIECGERALVLSRSARYWLDELSARGGDAPRPVALIDNIRAALEWCFSDGADATLGRELAVAACKEFLSRFMLMECKHWCGVAIASISPDEPVSSNRLSLQLSLAISMMHTLGNVDQVGTAIDQGLEMAYALEDRDAQLHLLAGRNLFLARRGAFLESLKAAQKFAYLAHETNDIATVATAEWMQGATYHLIGQQR